MAIAGHYWYAFLDKRFPGKSGKTVLKKLGCEIPAGPPLGLAFFVVVGALQGKPIDKTWSQFKENLVWLCLVRQADVFVRIAEFGRRASSTATHFPIFQADWIFYVPLQAFNFLYLAPKYRFLYVACLNLVYDTFLSFILHRVSLTKRFSRQHSSSSTYPDLPRDSNCIFALSSPTASLTMLKAKHLQFKQKRHTQ